MTKWQISIYFLGVALIAFMVGIIYSALDMGSKVQALVSPPTQTATATAVPTATNTATGTPIATAARAPTASPPPVIDISRRATAPSVGPLQAIDRYYALINDRNYADAYDLMGPGIKATASLGVFAGWFANKLSIRAEQVRLVYQRDIEAEVEAMVLSSDKVDGEVLSKRYRERWRLVPGEATWFIDTRLETAVIEANTPVPPTRTPAPLTPDPCAVQWSNRYSIAPWTSQAGWWNVSSVGNRIRIYARVFGGNQQVSVRLFDSAGTKLGEQIINSEGTAQFVAPYVDRFKWDVYNSFWSVSKTVEITMTSCAY